MIRVSPRPSRRWLPAHALAVGFSLGHVILDWHAGMGESKPEQAAE